METIDYRNYAAGTIMNYPLKYRKHLLTLFLEKNIARKDAQTVIDAPNAVDISDLGLNDQLIKCIENNLASFAILEKWEFCKDYKYSVLFSTENFGELLSSVNEKTVMFDSQKVPVPLHSRIEVPQLLNVEEDLSLLKFNLKFEAFNPQTADELLTRYPVVVAFHKTMQIVEIRFDALTRIFMENADGFYARLIVDVCDFIKKQYGFKLIPINLDFLVNLLQNENGEARLIAESMKMSNGSYAKLDVGKNEEYVLPFIGELKGLFGEYEAEFEKVPKLKEAFEQFIFEKEVTSDYPWIEVLLENEIKTRAIHVKFTFNYSQMGCCLLQHYFNNALIGMERMNHVIKYIYEIRRNSGQ